MPLAMATSNRFSGSLAARQNARASESASPKAKPKSDVPSGVFSGERRRYFVIVVPLILGIVLSTLLYLELVEQEERDFRLISRTYCTGVSAGLSESISAFLAIPHLLAAHAMSATSAPTRNTYTEWFQSSSMMNSKMNSSFLAWRPRVQINSKESFETTTGSELGILDFVMWRVNEVNPIGAPDQVDVQPEYFPYTYSEEVLFPRVGYDDTILFPNLLNAFDHTSRTLSPALTLFTPTNGCWDINKSLFGPNSNVPKYDRTPCSELRYFVPIFDVSHSVLDGLSETDRKGHFLGVIEARTPIQTLLDSTTAGEPEISKDYGITVSASGVDVATHQAGVSLSTSTSQTSTFDLSAFPFYSTQNGDAGALTLECSPTSSSESAFSSSVAVISIVVGLIVTLVATATLYFFLRRMENTIKTYDAKARFLSNVSHELRTPLQSILGSLTCALKTKDSQSKKSYINMCQQAAEHMLTIVNDLLDLAKLEQESDSLKMKITEFDLRNSVRNALLIVMPNANKKNLELGVEISPDVPDIIRSDESRIRQVLLNFLSNAIKFTNSGHVVVRISVTDKKKDSSEGYTGSSIDSSGNLISSETISRTFNNSRVSNANPTKKRTSAYLLFEVCDTGRGISEGDKKKLFNRFAQVDSAGSTRKHGTGLGLAISRRIARMLSGEAGVRDNDGLQGSVFWFTAQVRVTPEVVIVPQNTDHIVVGIGHESKHDSPPSAIALRNLNDGNVSPLTPNRRTSSSTELKVPSTVSHTPHMSAFSTPRHGSQENSFGSHILDGDFTTPDKRPLAIVVHPNHSWRTHICKYLKASSHLPIISMWCDEKTKKASRSSSSTLHLSKRNAHMVPNYLPSPKQAESNPSSLQPKVVLSGSVLDVTLGTDLSDFVLSEFLREHEDVLDLEKILLICDEEGSLDEINHVVHLLKSLLYEGNNQREPHSPQIIPVSSDFTDGQGSSSSYLKWCPRWVGVMHFSLHGVQSHVVDTLRDATRSLFQDEEDKRQMVIDIQMIEKPIEFDRFFEDIRAMVYLSSTTGIPGDVHAPVPSHGHMYTSSAGSSRDLRSSGSDVLLEVGGQGHIAGSSNAASALDLPSLDDEVAGSHHRHGDHSDEKTLHEEKLSDSDDDYHKREQEKEREEEEEEDDGDDRKQNDSFIAASPYSHGLSINTSETSFSHRRLNVLVVEDYEFNQLILGQYLKNLGHRFKVASDGAQAVAFVEDSINCGDYFDAILMDCMMPVMDGFDATEAIRALEREKGAKWHPILGLTASSDKEDLDRCLSSGMDCALNKPIMEDALQAKLEEFTSPTSPLN